MPIAEGTMWNFQKGSILLNPQVTLKDLWKINKHGCTYRSKAENMPKESDGLNTQRTKYTYVLRKDPVCFTLVAKVTNFFQRGVISLLLFELLIKIYDIFVSILRRERMYHRQTRFESTWQNHHPPENRKYIKRGINYDYFWQLLPMYLSL